MGIDNAISRGTPSFCWSLDPARRRLNSKLFDLPPLLKRIVDSVLGTGRQFQGLSDESI